MLATCPKLKREFNANSLIVTGLYCLMYIVDVSTSVKLRKNSRPGFLKSYYLINVAPCITVR